MNLSEGVWLLITAALASLVALVAVWLGNASM
jgi:hypothetical protein